MKLEGFKYATSLDLKVGYDHIKLMPAYTIVFPWGKHNTNNSKTFVIHTDASNAQLGMIISQDNCCHIEFYSHKLNLAQHDI
jgi:hypothetical protein